jgi:GGDEF domain-containing protein
LVPTSLPRCLQQCARGVDTIARVGGDEFAAAAERRSVRAGQRLIEVTWLTITDAGRQALAG